MDTSDYDDAYYDKTDDQHIEDLMSARVLLNSLNELGKKDKMRGLSSIYIFFGNEFNKFNKKRTRMLESI